MHPLLNIAISAARQAGDIIVRHSEHLEHLKVSTKANAEYFSEVDLKAEQTIINIIHKAYPDHGIIAEEGGTMNEDADVTWIIDPLDGTNNYLHGFPFYAVSIGIKVKNKIEHGVVYDPVRFECFAASKGRGARLNDRRLRVSKQNQLANSLLGTGIPTIKNENEAVSLPALESLIGKCVGIRRTGASALDLAYVAAGRLDGFWEYGLRLWDMAAGVLLIQEAGGLICDFKGQDQFLQSGNIITGNSKIFKPLLQTLLPSLRETA